MTDDVMEAAQAEARRVAAELIEKRVKGLQRIIAKRDIEIAALRRQLAQQEATPHE